MRFFILSGVALSLLMICFTLSAATIEVDSNSEKSGSGGKCSLREAIQALNLQTEKGKCKANGPFGQKDMIVFSKKLSGATFFIDEGEILIESGANGLSIDAGLLDKRIVLDSRGKSRIFSVLERDLFLKNIVIKNGVANDGGGIRSEGNLYLDSCRFENNRASGLGGGVMADRITIQASHFSNNHATYDGGGVWGYSGVDASKSFFDGNTASQGGAIFSLGKIKSEENVFHRDCPSRFLKKIECDSVFEGLIKP